MLRVGKETSFREQKGNNIMSAKVKLTRYTTPGLKSVGGENFNF